MTLVNFFVGALLFHYSISFENYSKVIAYQINFTALFNAVHVIAQICCTNIF